MIANLNKKLEIHLFSVDDTLVSLKWLYENSKPCFRKRYLVVSIGYVEGSRENRLAVPARAESWQNNLEGREDTIWWLMGKMR